MSLLFREQRDDAAQLIPDRRRNSTVTAGVRVDNDTADRHSSVWACRAAVAEAIQQLPLDETVRTKDRETIRRDPPRLFHEPAAGVSWNSWIWAQAWNLTGRGKCYAYVTGIDRSGIPTGLELVDPDVVTWRYDRQKNSWTVLLDREPIDLWPLGELWHCPLYVTTKRPDGMSPIEHHAETIGVGLASQKFGAQFFGDSGHPTHIFTTERDPGVKGAQALKERIMDVLRGNREPLVLPAHIKAERWQVTPDESQFLDTMRYSGEDICRIMGVPPGKVALAISGQNVTYTNTADANADWRVSGLARYIGALESALSRLVSNDPVRMLRFDFDAFLRGDQKARFEGYKLAAEVGQLSGTPVLLPNEMRAKEGLGPLKGGDEFRPPAKPDPLQQRERIELSASRPAPVETHIHLPESVDVQLRNDQVAEAIDRVSKRGAEDVAAVVAAITNLPTPVVNVAAADVTVNVPTTPVQLTFDMPAPVVNVAPAEVIVVPAAPTSKTVELSVGGKKVTGTISEE